MSGSYSKTNDKVRGLLKLDGKSRPENCKFQNPRAAVNILVYSIFQNSLELISQLKCRSRLSGLSPAQTTPDRTGLPLHFSSFAEIFTCSNISLLESWSNVVRMMWSSRSITGVFSKGEYTNYVYHNRREESLLSLGATFHHLSHHLYGEEKTTGGSNWSVGDGRWGGRYRVIETTRPSWMLSSSSGELKYSDPQTGAQLTQGNSNSFIKLNPTFHIPVWLILPLTWSSIKILTFRKGLLNLFQREMNTNWVEFIVCIVSQLWGIMISIINAQFNKLAG